MHRHTGVHVHIRGQDKPGPVSAEDPEMEIHGQVAHLGHDPRKHRSGPGMRKEAEKAVDRGCASGTPPSGT